MLHKTVFKKYMIFFCENNSPPLRSHSISKRNAMDHRKSLLGLFFYLNPQRLIFFFWNVLYHCTWSQGQVRLSLTFRFSSAERHSLPHVTLSVACYSWPIYLIYFYGGFFWDNKKNVLGYLPWEMKRKCCQSRRMADHDSHFTRTPLWGGEWGWGVSNCLCLHFGLL